MSDFAYAYWVDDKIAFRRIQGVAVGFYDKVHGSEFDAVISLEAAKRLVKDLTKVIEENK